MSIEGWPDSGEGFRRLAVYGRSMALVEAIYRLTSNLPATEQYGLVSQMRRAATSIPLNIAEGYGRRHRGDYVRMLSIARGSAFELDTQMEIVVRLDLVSRESVRTPLGLCIEVRKMLSTMITKLAD